MLTAGGSGFMGFNPLIDRVDGLIFIYRLDINNVLVYELQNDLGGVWRNNGQLGGIEPTAIICFKRVRVRNIIDDK